MILYVSLEEKNGDMLRSSVVEASTLGCVVPCAMECTQGSGITKMTTN